MSSLEEEEDWNLGVSMVEDGFIEDLIDGEERCWQMDLIEDLFSAEEVRIISNIPLSLRPSEDRLVWHFNRKGVYNVKSGYHAMRTWRGVGVQASTSSMVVEGAVSGYLALCLGTRTLMCFSTSSFSGVIGPIQFCRYQFGF